MTDMNYRPDQSPNFTAEELEIIRYFAQGQKHSISSNNLKLEYTETSIRLSNNNGKLLGIAKQTNEWQRKVLITNNSIYRNIIIQNLMELGFIDLQRSSHPNFTEHHYYKIPTGYKLNYTEVIQLWRAWWNSKRDQLNVTSVPIEISIFARGNWYQVQDLQPRQGNFILQTARGELTIPPEDHVVWIDKIESISLTSLTQVESEVGSQADISRSSAQSIDNAELPEQEEEDIDLESYLNTFTTDETGDIDRIEGIYNIGELLRGTNREEDSSTNLSSPVLETTNSLPSEPAIIPAQFSSPEAAPTTSIEPLPRSPLSEIPTTQSSLAYVQAQQALKLKAINALSRYLQQGDVIVRTEVLRNAQGQEISRKVTTIQSGCPRWVIAQIRKLS